MIKKISILLLLFFTFSFLIRDDFSFDQDLGRHIKLGEIIVKTHSVSNINLFSYTNPNFPFINTHWLFEVFAYSFTQIAPINWLLYLKIIIILISVYITIISIQVSTRRVSAYFSVLLLLVGFIFLHVLRERLDLRPEIFSFLFTALTLYILKSYACNARKDQPFEAKTIFLLPIIQLFWINTHIYFFVGVVLQAIFLIYLGYLFLRCQTGFVKLKLLAVVFALSVGVSFVNPNGLKGVLYPLNVQNNYGYTIVENQTMFLLENIGFRDRNFLFVKLAFAIILLSIFVGYKRKTLNLLNLSLIAFGSFIALLNVRGFPYLVFICLPSVLENFGIVKPSFFIKSITYTAAFLLIVESFLYLNGSYYKYTDSQNTTKLTLPESGKGAMDFALAQNLPGPIYNNFDIGSYIIYRSYPKYRVFVDGRPEAYPKEFFQNIYIPTQSDYQQFQKLDEQDKFKTIIFSHTDQTPWGKAFLSSISRGPGWNPVYIDDSWVVYVKKDIADNLNLKTIDLTKLDPNNFNYSNHFSYLKIASFLINTNNIVAANAFLDKALTIFPDSPIANGIKGQILLSTGDLFNQSLAQNYLQKSKNIFFW